MHLNPFFKKKVFIFNININLVNKRLKTRKEMRLLLIIIRNFL